MRVWLRLERMKKNGCMPNAVEIRAARDPKRFCRLPDNVASVVNGCVVGKNPRKVLDEIRERVERNVDEPVSATDMFYRYDEDDKAWKHERHYAWMARSGGPCSLHRANEEKEKAEAENDERNRKIVAIFRKFLKTGRAG